MSEILEVGETFNCKTCKFKSNRKYNLKRHIENQHDGDDEPSVPDITEEDEVTNSVTCISEESKPSIDDVLDNLGLCHLRENF
jgi:hypothetical protein